MVITSPSLQLQKDEWEFLRRTVCLFIAYSQSEQKFLGYFISVHHCNSTTTNPLDRMNKLFAQSRHSAPCWLRAHVSCMSFIHSFFSSHNNIAVFFSAQIFSISWLEDNNSSSFAPLNLILDKQDVMIVVRL